MDYAILLATMTVSEFRAFKRAYAVLRRAGMCQQDAISVLCERASERVASRLRHVS